MTQAAYCSQCQANVYVGEDGRCPQGHGPESLSNHYDVPDVEAPTPAQAARATATSPAPTKSKLPWILGIIALLLVLCGVGSCVAIGAVLDSATDEMDSAIEESMDALEEEMDEAIEGVDDIVEETGEVPAEDIQTMVAHFYPGFTLESYYTVTLADGPDDASTYHIIASYDNVPDFWITFFTFQSEAENPTGSDLEGQAFYDDATAAWWIHPQTRDHSLDSVFGPEALIGAGPMLDQVATDFTAVHPTKVVTDVSALTNMDLGFRGIDVAELADWYDDSESFESTWELDIHASPSVYVEVDYQEF